MSRLLSAAIPMPVSWTATRKVTVSCVTASASTRTATSPRSVHLIALPTKLTRIWPIRPVSPTRSSGTPGRISLASLSDFAWERDARVLTVSPRGSRRAQWRARERGVQEERRHADDAIRRRPDPVPHRGQELGLRAVRGLGGRFLLLQ